MKARVAASVVLAVGVVIGTAGCNLIAPQETTQILQPTAFGVGGDVGQVHIGNAYLVAKSGKAALVATFVNMSDSPKTLTIQPNASQGDTKTVELKPGKPTVIGPDKHLQWNDLNASKGSLLPVYFTYGGTSGTTLKVPVLTGDFDINSTLTPTPKPTPTQTSTQTPAPTGTPSSAPTGAPTETPTPTSTPAAG